MSDEFVENIKQSSAWLRILFMAGFVIALYVAGVVLIVLMLAQILFTLITGADNLNLRRLGAAISLYVTQILDFLTYNSELKPFPFMAFPLLDTVADAEAAEVSAAAATARAADQQAADTAAESAAVAQAEVAARKADSHAQANEAPAEPGIAESPENVATGDAAPTSVADGPNKDV